MFGSCSSEAPRATIWIERVTASPTRKLGVPGVHDVLSSTILAGKNQPLACRGRACMSITSGARGNRLPWVHEFVVLTKAIGANGKLSLINSDQSGTNTAAVIHCNTDENRRITNGSRFERNKTV